MKASIHGTLLLTVLLATTASASDLEHSTSELLQARLFSEAVTTLEAVGETDASFGVAQRLLGEIYASGLGVTPDKPRAIRFFREAAKHGDMEATYRLGHAYETGEGVEASAVSAYTWYDAAALEHPQAACRYAEIALANRDKAGFVARHDPIDRLRFAADGGVARAQFLLGQLALTGTVDGISEEEAFSLLEGASASEAEANTTLGMHAHQSGDIDTARDRFAKALAMGDSSAAAYLGHYAEHGMGEPINRKKAWDYYQQAKSVTWTAESLRRLRRNSESIELLGMRMYGATRPEVWNRFRALQLPLLANETHWDAFDASARLGGKKSILTVAYAPQKPEYVAEISYRLEAADRRAGREMYKEVQASLMAKYGEVVDTTRDRSIRRLYWHLEDAVIELASSTSEPIITITYQLMPYSTSLRNFLAKNDPKGDIRDAL